MRLPTTPRVVLTAFPDGVGDLGLVGDGANSLVAQRRAPGDDGWVVVASSNPVTNALDYGIAGNGVDDNRLAVQALLDSVPTGTIVRFPKGDYVIGVKPGVGTVNRHSITFSGSDVSIIGDGPGTRFIFRGAPNGANKSMFGIVSGARRLLFADCQFIQGDLTGTVDEQTHMIEILPDTDDVEDVYFRRCHWGTIKGDCIRLLATTGRLVRRVTVDSCVMDGFRFAGDDPGYGFRAGISVQRGVQGLLVHDSYFTGATDSVFDCEPSGVGVEAQFDVHHNHFDHRTKGGDGSGVAVAVSIGGIDSDQAMTDLRFCGNLVSNGRVAIKAVSRAVITGNVIVDGTISTVTPVVELLGACTDVVISDNILVSSAASGANIGLNVMYQGSASPARVTIARNRITWALGSGIRVNSCAGLIVSGNDLRFAGASTNAEHGILLTADIAAMPEVLVTGNSVRGDAGGGTLQRGVHLAPSSTSMGGAVVGSNLVRGSVVGVNLANGTWTDTPVVEGNAVVGATTPVSFNSQVAVVGGNAGSRAIYSGAASDPATLADFGATGSGYISGNGQHYIKTAAGASGWKLVTHA